MTIYGLTPDGFVAKTLEEIQAAMVAKQRDSIDPTLDTSRYGLIGQLNDVMASEIAAVWELAEAVNDAQDPDKARGAAQDALYSLTGSTREGAKRSLVVCECTLQPGVAIVPGEAIASVVGNPSARFANAVPLVNAGAAVAVVAAQFEALEPGRILANANTLTVRETLITGWDAVNNPADAQPGSGVESDPEFRSRREEELFAQGGGTVDGIRAELLKLPTVVACNVFENTSDVVSPEGLPPKSFCAVVHSDEGADDAQAIAETIWANKPAGILAYGDEPPTLVVDSEGQQHEIRFKRPDETAVYVALRLTSGAGYIGDAAVKEAIIASAETPNTEGYLDVGVDVYAGHFVKVAMGLRGVLNAECRVSATSADYDAGEPSLVISSFETATLDSSRISIVPIP